MLELDARGVRRVAGGDWWELTWGDGTKEIVRVDNIDDAHNRRHPSVTVTHAGPKPIGYVYIDEEWPAVRVLPAGQYRLGKVKEA